MAKPALDWTVNLAKRPMEKFMNLASAPMPAWSWRPRALRAPREWMAHWAPGMGHVQLDGLATAGMPVVLMPERIYGRTSSPPLDEVKSAGATVRRPAVRRLVAPR